MTSSLLPLKGPDFSIFNVDATGCGDTYTIGYLYQRVSGAGIEEAGRFAAAMSTLKIKKSGPFNGSKEDVIQCMTTAEQMF